MNEAVYTRIYEIEERIKDNQLKERSNDKVLNDITREYKNQLCNQEECITNKLKIESFEKDITENLGVYERNLEEYLGKLNDFQEERGFIQEIDLQLQNALFLLENKVK